ncbi:Kinase [Hexamita inflata]|uniref:Kinase n=1 Tax=Hexamita inflata TaxID=28002 RepID=A0AA86TQH6_9EUKA|nr:Kinase [Hexamita inflata]
MDGPSLIIKIMEENKDRRLSFDEIKNIIQDFKAQPIYLSDVCVEISYSDQSMNLQIDLHEDLNKKIIKFQIVGFMNRFICRPVGCLMLCVLLKMNCVDANDINRVFKYVTSNNITPVFVQLLADCAINAYQTDSQKAVVYSSLLYMQQYRNIGQQFLDGFKFLKFKPECILKQFLENQGENIELILQCTDALMLQQIFKVYETNQQAAALLLMQRKVRKATIEAELMKMEEQTDEEQIKRAVEHKIFNLFTLMCAQKETDIEYLLVYAGTNQEMLIQLFNDKFEIQRINSFPHFINLVRIAAEHIIQTTTLTNSDWQNIMQNFIQTVVKTALESKALNSLDTVENEKSTKFFFNILKEFLLLLFCCSQNYSYLILQELELVQFKSIISTIIYGFVKIVALDFEDSRNNKDGSTILNTYIFKQIQNIKGQCAKNVQYIVLNQVNLIKNQIIRISQCDSIPLNTIYTRIKTTKEVFGEALNKIVIYYSNNQIINECIAQPLSNMLQILVNSNQINFQEDQITTYQEAKQFDIVQTIQSSFYLVQCFQSEYTQSTIQQYTQQLKEYQLKIVRQGSQLCQIYDQLSLLPSISQVTSQQNVLNAINSYLDSIVTKTQRQNVKEPQQLYKEIFIDAKSVEHLNILLHVFSSWIAINIVDRQIISNVISQFQNEKNKDYTWPIDTTNYLEQKLISQIRKMTGIIQQTAANNNEILQNIERYTSIVVSNNEEKFTNFDYDIEIFKLLQRFNHGLCLLIFIQSNNQIQETNRYQQRLFDILVATTIITIITAKQRIAEIINTCYQLLYQFVNDVSYQTLYFSIISEFKECFQNNLYEQWNPSNIELQKLIQSKNNNYCNHNDIINNLIDYYNKEPNICISLTVFKELSRFMKLQPEKCLKLLFKTKSITNLKQIDSKILNFIYSEDNISQINQYKYFKQNYYKHVLEIINILSYTSKIHEDDKIQISNSNMTVISKFLSKIIIYLQNNMTTDLYSYCSLVTLTKFCNGCSASNRLEFIDVEYLAYLNKFKDIRLSLKEQDKKQDTINWFIFNILEKILQKLPKTNNYISDIFKTIQEHIYADYQFCKFFIIVIITSTSNNYLIQNIIQEVCFGLLSLTNWKQYINVKYHYPQEMKRQINQQYFEVVHDIIVNSNLDYNYIFKVPIGIQIFDKKDVLTDNQQFLLALFLMQAGQYKIASQNLSVLWNQFIKQEITPINQNFIQITYECQVQAFNIINQTITQQQDHCILNIKNNVNQLQIVIQDTLKFVKFMKFEELKFDLQNQTNLYYSKAEVSSIIVNNCIPNQIFQHLIDSNVDVQDVQIFLDFISSQVISEEIAELLIIQILTASQALTNSYIHIKQSFEESQFILISAFKICWSSYVSYKLSNDYLHMIIQIWSLIVQFSIQNEKKLTKDCRNLIELNPINEQCSQLSITMKNQSTSNSLKLLSQLHEIASNLLKINLELKYVKDAILEISSNAIIYTYHFDHEMRQRRFYFPDVESNKEKIDKTNNMYKQFNLVLKQWYDDYFNRNSTPEQLNKRQLYKNYKEYSAKYTNTIRTLKSQAEARIYLCTIQFLQIGQQNLSEKEYSLTCLPYLRKNVSFVKSIDSKDKPQEYMSEFTEHFLIKQKAGSDANVTSYLTHINNYLQNITQFKVRPYTVSFCYSQDNVDIFYIEFVQNIKSFTYNTVKKNQDTPTLQKYEYSKKPYFMKIHDMFNIQRNYFISEIVQSEKSENFYQYNTAMKYYQQNIERVDSIACWTVLTFVLAMGDRHTGNIMMDSKTQALHFIDFESVFALNQMLPVTEQVSSRNTPYIVSLVSLGNYETRYIDVALKLLHQIQINIHHYCKTFANSQTRPYQQDAFLNLQQLLRSPNIDDMFLRFLQRDMDSYKLSKCYTNWQPFDASNISTAAKGW